MAPACSCRPGRISIVARARPWRGARSPPAPRARARAGLLANCAWPQRPRAASVLLEDEDPNEDDGSILRITPLDILAIFSAFYLAAKLVQRLFRRTAPPVLKKGQ